MNFVNGKKYKNIIITKKEQVRYNAKIQGPKNKWMVWGPQGEGPSSYYGPVLYVTIIQPP